jgi:hypothetical protein
MWLSNQWIANGQVPERRHESIWHIGTACNRIGDEIWNQTLGTRLNEQWFKVCVIEYIID